MLRRTSETRKAGWGADRPPAKVSIIPPSENDLRELIAIRAYELYAQRGSALGDETTDWLMAEAEVLSCLQTRPLDPQPAPRSRNGAKKVAPKVTAPSRAPRTLAATSNRKNKPRSEAA